MKPLSEFRRHCLIFGVLFAIACIVFYLVVREYNISSSVVDGYFPYADAMMSGTLPYTDKVFVYGDWGDWEYPPAAYLFLFIPRLFAGTPEGYQAAFIILTFVFFMIGLWCSAALAKLYGGSGYLAMLIYSVTMFLMLEFLLDRYDIFPMVITMVSIYCLLTKRYVLAFVLLSVATLTKLYPGVLFPIYLIPLLVDREWKTAAIGTLAFVGLALVAIIPLLIAGSDILMFVTYHSDRPLEIESVAASFISVASMLGLTDTSVLFSYGSDNLVGALPDAVFPFMMPITIILLLVLYAAYTAGLLRLKKGGNNTEQKKTLLFILVSFFAVAVFISAGKVFSGQYMVWLISFLPLMLVLMQDRIHMRNLFSLFVLAEILTQLNFAVNFGMRGEGEEMTDAGIILIFVRNIAVIVIMLIILRCIKRGNRIVGECHESSI